MLPAAHKIVTGFNRVTFLQQAPKGVTTSAAHRQVHTMTVDKKPFQRLPSDVIPTNYKLRLQPDLQAFTFQGSSEISVQVMYFSAR